MPLKPGKRFEADFKNSVPEHVFYYRFRDGTATFGEKQDNIRFQAKNICDCQLFTGVKLYLLELKSIKGPSISFSNFQNSKKVFKYSELRKAADYKNIISGFVVNFRDYKRTYFISSEMFYDFVNNSDRKSFPIKFFEDNCYIILASKLRVNYKYDLNEFTKVYDTSTHKVQNKIW